MARLQRSESVITKGVTHFQILHVDEDINFLKVVKQALESEKGFKITIALSVDKAVKKMEEQSFDAIVSDYEMPSKNGLDFLKELRQQNNTIPFILFTGKGREEVAAQALNLGADGYYSKHGSPETVYGELAQGIRLIIEHNRAKEALRISNEQYRALIDSMTDTVWVIDFDGNFVDVNDTAVRVLGYSKEELLSMSPSDIDAGLSRDQLNNLAETVLKGKKQVFETVHVTKDGKKLPVEISSNIVVYQGKKAVLSIARDITKQKQMRNKIAATQKRYYQMFNQAPVGILLIDSETLTAIEFNNEAHQQLGYSREEFAKLSIPAYQAVERPEEIRAHVKQILEKGKDVFETKHVTKTGEVRNVKIFAQAIELSGKKLIHSLTQDITENMKMAEALKEQKLELEDLYENAPAMYLSVNVEKTIIGINKTMYQQLGYTKEELLGKQITEIFTEASQKSLMEQYPVLLKTGYLHGVERQLIRKDGSIIEVIGDVSTSYSKEGKLLSNRAVFRDVTKQKQIERLLMESEAKHRQILELADEGILAFNNEGNIGYVNPRLAEILGYQAEDAIHKPVFSFINNSDTEQFAYILESLKKGNKKRFEQTLIKKDGTKIYARLSASPIADETGEYVGVIALVSDITERKEMQKRLHELAYRLNGLSSGHSYLCESHEQVFKAYSDLTFHNTPGLCIAREDPEKIVNEYGVKPEEILLLSSKALKGFEALPDLQALSLTISKFLKANNAGIVLLDGLEYLISVFGFDAVYRFIQEKRFDFLENGALLLIPVNMAALSEKEKALLISEIKLLPGKINQPLPRPDEPHK